MKLFEVEVGIRIGERVLWVRGLGSKNKPKPEQVRRWLLDDWEDLFGFGFDFDFGFRFGVRFGLSSVLEREEILPRRPCEDWVLISVRRRGIRSDVLVLNRGIQDIPVFLNDGKENWFCIGTRCLISRGGEGISDGFSKDLTNLSFFFSFLEFRVFFILLNYLA